MNSLALFQNALKMARKFETTYPELGVLRSIIGQLEYLVAIELGTENDRSRLKDIIVGVQAAREIDSIDLKFADVLYQVAEAVERMRLSGKAGVKLRDGRIDVGSIILEPALDEASFLAVIGDAAKPLVHNVVYHSYLLPKATVHGRDFRTPP